MSVELLKRKPDGFSEVQSIWTRELVVCIGGGPSLTGAQVEMVRGRARVIAVNDAYLLAPWADVCYFADSEWWQWHTAGVARPALGLTAEQVRERFATFAGQKCTIEHAGAHVKDPVVHRLRKAGREGLSLDPGALITGGNSGFQALNMAVLSGARIVILLGYDAREPKTGEPSHWFGEHPRVAPVSVFQSYRDSFRAAENEIREAGVRVINASPGSAITRFEMMSLDQALDECLAPTA